MSSDNTLIEPKTIGRENLKALPELEDSNRLLGADYSSLVNVNGKLGLFTPITDDEDVEVSKENLEKIIQTLRRSIATLQNENQVLKQKIETLIKAQTRTPDDFSTAISHTVDSLQSRLHDMKNPVSRFAMREFKIEAKVHVDVSPLGTVEYRFLKPEESVDPNRLSKIEMSLVPIPKEEVGYDPTSFTPFTDIEEINGIGETYQRKLNEHNIYSINDLLTAGTRVRSRVELASMLGVDRNKLSLWINQAELLTIKKIDGRKAEVLHMIGVDNLEQLANQAPETLTQHFNDKVGELSRTTLKPVTEEEVSGWIASAFAFQNRNRQA